VRSIAIAVAVGVAWAGPLEHITAESSQAADRWFPGLQLEALAAGGTTDVSLERALLLTAITPPLRSRRPPHAQPPRPHRLSRAQH
jgi:hypothetical protein